jgi:hypothetical protein
MIARFLKRFFSGFFVPARMADEELAAQRQYQSRPICRDPFCAPTDPVPMPVPETTTQVTRPPVVERRQSTYSSDKQGFIDIYELVS